ncbi:UNVERIFIED_CONTAM: hypothetical protein PYX00_005567 [Menopon gallinae]|uniref:Platelet-derived growth factor (PDGF) family profile domain-containing protein n=1 Tax=Menopon gallinae TaxID=328185 RepID=A0AAW2HTR1_9NEOP
MVNFVCVLLLLTWRVSFSVQNEDKYKGNAIVFPENIPPPKKEIPLALIRQINDHDIANVNELMDNFVEPESWNKTFGIIPRIGLGDVERSAIKSAKMAKCMPELRTVSLAPELDNTVFYYPSCTRVERCGGCCAHKLLSCQPLESEIIQLSVVVLEYRGGSQLSFKQKEVIGVEQHKKCKCDCKVQPEHCTKYQKYNKEKCSCECNNTDDEEKCHQQRGTKIWNKDLCSCMCKEELECSSGFYFDPFHCQ